MDTVYCVSMCLLRSYGLSMMCSAMREVYSGVESRVKNVKFIYVKLYSGSNMELLGYVQFPIPHDERLLGWFYIIHLEQNFLT